MIRLFTTWYRDKNPARQAEYVRCLEANLALAKIDEVCVLAEAFLEPRAKLRLLSVTSRPSYDDFINWINDIAAARDISIIANTDIYFDSSIRLAERFLEREECYALARWDGDTLSDRNDSQDAWIFRGRVAGVRGDFNVGVPRCDNRFLHELRKAGYSVRNPSFAIRANHVHAGARAEYDVEGSAGWVEPPYEYLWPHNLLSLPRTLMHNASHANERIVWRADWRKPPLNLPRRILNKVSS